MRVLMSNYEFPPIGGGAGLAHLNLLRQFADNPEITVDVVTSCCGRGLTVERFAENITLYKVGIRKRNLHHWRRSEVLEWLLKAPAHYRRLIKTNQYDLAHAFSAFPTGWLCWRTRANMPYILSLLGSDVPGHNARLTLDYRLLGPLFRRIWESSALVVVNSAGLTQRARVFMPELHYPIIYTGVDATRFHPPAVRADSKTIRLVTASRLVATKRIDVLIEAVGLLKQEGVDVQLTVAGGGRLAEPLKQLVQQRGLNEHVRLLGPVDAEAMPQLYRDSDIFVSSSVREGLSNAMLEAMASGLPIVTARCEGVDELVVDNGLIVEEPHPRCIADAICLVQEQSRYKAMSAAARARVERFTWQQTAEAYLDCYRQVIT
ncbi:MAG: glycosyltransferase family 4 protein [Phycisphaerae bacterium]|nr:glycosyltransferase family 4 protein [Phycisphaerae bacterium]